MGANLRGGFLFEAGAAKHWSYNVGLMMLRCEVALSCYAESQSSHKYCVAITRPDGTGILKAMDADGFLRVTINVLGHTAEEANDMLENLRSNQPVPPYYRDIDEGVLRSSGF